MCSKNDGLDRLFYLGPHLHAGIGWWRHMAALPTSTTGLYLGQRMGISHRIRVELQYAQKLIQSQKLALASTA